MTTDSPQVAAAAPAAPGLVSAGDTLTIYTVEAFGAACRTELDRSAAVSIDLSRVQACDSLGIQVLCAARRSAEAKGRSLQFVSPSAVVARAASAIGCEALFTSNPLQP